MKKVMAKKKFGQNFLKDMSVLNKIIQSMPKNNFKLVEIGPGLGDLTQMLLRAKPLRAYEVDRDLCVHLREKFRKEIAEERLKLEQIDVLECFDKGSLENEPYDLVANLPYYIATKIILEALEDENCNSMIVMIQKEVALKFSAPAKTKEFTFLAILSQSIADVELLFDVPSGSFEPTPKVTSSILKIVKRREFIRGDKPLFETDKEFIGFKKYLKISYSSPRKTWVKNISSIYNRDFARKLLEDMDISANTRPHEISVANHLNLYEKISKR
ncbi:MAG: 16S rRNA (adenine(1518)-N(6)/adenine(1519)-N(6))-dimethyltransferase RsmA [Campylobacteraceae bacterium]|nr:16S rRNA (adenine(1518)-N(6)/adenine(1519)-N(6))-dimethyltransferase RsmA [Campylobacteraceae bacterium]